MPRLTSSHFELRTPKPAAARQLVLIFAASGVLAFAGAAAPGSTYKEVFVGIGVCDLVVAALARLTMSRPVPSAWVLAIGAGAGLAVISVAGRHDAMPAAAVFVVLLFVWVGANFPPGVSWWLLPAAALAYLFAVGPQDVGPEGRLPQLFVMLAGCVIVAETIARSMARLRLAEAQVQARVTQLRTLGENAVELNSLDADVVMETAVRTLLRLGHDAAAIALLDHESEQLRLTHARGLIPAGAAAAIMPGDRGVTGRALQLDATVVEDDYPSAPDALPDVVAAGFRTMIATPLHADDGVLGVLICAARGHGSPTMTDPETVELLAAHVGRALRNATEYADQELAAAHHASQAFVDPLTGVGNRRHGETLLASLQPGDTVLLFDLDNFKAINDTFGHAGGDQVLQDFARFLRGNVRHDDGVARMGGEEFIVVWRVQAAGAGAPTPRLVDGWRATGPRATVSAGLAEHRGDRTPADTLAAADAALYAAKRQGRDRIVCGA